jgi:large subunit ribosomal protein L33
MAKKKKGGLIRMVSSERTGTFYVAKSSAKKTESLALRKYDKKVRRHVIFKEAKMK